MIPVVRLSRVNVRTELTVTATGRKRIQKTRKQSTSGTLCLRPKRRGADTEKEVFLTKIIFTGLIEVIALRVSI